MIWKKFISLNLKLSLLKLKPQNLPYNMLNVTISKFMTSGQIMINITSLLHSKIPSITSLWASSKKIFYYNPLIEYADLNPSSMDSMDHRLRTWTMGTRKRCYGVASNFKGSVRGSRCSVWAQKRGWTCLVVHVVKYQRVLMDSRVYNLGVCFTTSIK